MLDLVSNRLHLTQLKLSCQEGLLGSQNKVGFGGWGRGMVVSVVSDGMLTLKKCVCSGFTKTWMK